MDAELILVIILFVGFILLMRLFGAWVLRINDVIYELRIIKEILGKSLTDQQREEINKKFSNR